MVLHTCPAGSASLPAVGHCEVFSLQVVQLSPLFLMCSPTMLTFISQLAHLPSYDCPCHSDRIGCSNFWWIRVLCPLRAVALAEQGQGWTFTAKIIHCELWWQWAPSLPVSHPQVLSAVCIPLALIPLWQFCQHCYCCLLCMLYVQSVVSPHPFLRCTPMAGRKQKSPPPWGLD